MRTHDGILEIFIDDRLICKHDILSGRNRVSRKKEHFKGLLKEVQNDGYAPYRKLPLMDFSGNDDVEVEKRSLTVYENLAGGEV